MKYVIFLSMIQLGCAEIGIVWRCDNHNGKHMAETEQERRNTSKANGCKGWYPTEKRR